MEKLTNVFKIEYTKGDTYALAIKFKNITEDLRTAYLSVKENPEDTTPLIQKSLGKGITKIDDRAYKNEKTYKFQLQPADTVNLEPKVQYLYDIQVTVGNVVKTVLHGVFVLNSTITGTSQITTPTLEVEIDDELETELGTTPATDGVEYEQDPVACAKIGDLSTLTTSNKETVVKAINEVKNNATTNAEDINKIKNGTIEVPKAKDVISKINGKDISEIFESNGTTVKKATEVTAKINGTPLTEIFEQNGKTVKDTTKINGLEIKKDENGVLKIGNIIIPQEKVLWSGETTNGTTGGTTEEFSYIPLSEDLSAGDTIECYTNFGLFKFKLHADGFRELISTAIITNDCYSITDATEVAVLLNSSPNVLQFKAKRSPSFYYNGTNQQGYTDKVTFYEVRKIIR